MTQKLIKLPFLILLAFILFSCSSSDETTKKTDQVSYQKDGVVAKMLEQARQYYLTALEKQNAKNDGAQGCQCNQHGIEKEHRGGLSVNKRR